MRAGKFLYGSLGFISALAGLLIIPQLGMSIEELNDAWHGNLPANFPKWDPYAAVMLTGVLCLGAFLMSFRLLRYAFSIKPPK